MVSSSIFSFVEFNSGNFWDLTCSLLLDQPGDDEEAGEIVLQQLPWEGTDRDYEYEEVFS